MSKKATKKLLLFNNLGSHFFQHLMPIARQAKAMGYDVTVLTCGAEYVAKIAAEEFKVINISINRKGLNPFAELMLLWRVYSIIKTEQPDIVHNFTVKPILYGTLASQLTKIKKTINNFLGMGYIFINNNLIAKLVRCLYISLLRITNFSKASIKYIVQNKEDQALLANYLQLSEIHILCSVGIEPSLYKDLTNSNKSGKIIFALVSRMLKDKGVMEFILAAKALKSKYKNCEFWLVGAPDPGNAASIDEATLQQHQGAIKYLGFQQDVQTIWQQADIAVLPSYREGLSRSLLEAAACGKAIITTNNSGGSELVTDRKNGLLVEAKSASSLERAMAELVDDASLRLRLARKIQQHVIENYNTKKIVTNIIDLY